ncbi:MAG: HD domain-containing protein [Tunicatimonas sp.]|uniref:HD domain-containing protein n=1 Tax=Tunicatimonas sp. TaxID=1940096 RepID=UPI003C788620
MSSLLLNRTEFGDPANEDKVPTKAEAVELLNDWVKSESLKRHMRQVGALMKAWAHEKENLPPEEQLKWELAGLLHDADWDQWPDQHCRKIIEELERRQVAPSILRAIASHGPSHFGVEPESSMDKMLYAFDELSGFIHAYSLMRPTGYEGMQPKGVKKRLKDKSFAAQVSREDITDASQRAEVDLTERITFIIQHQAEVQ